LKQALLYANCSESTYAIPLKERINVADIIPVNRLSLNFSFVDFFEESAVLRKGTRLAVLG